MTLTQNPLSRPWARWLAILLALTLFIGVLTVLIHAALGNTQIGADFYTIWMGGRSFFVDHQNPYSPEVTHAIQLSVYGRPAQGAEDHLGFAYPAYNLIPLLPFILMDFAWANAAWMAFNFVILLVSIIAASPKAPPVIVATIPFFYPFTFCLLLGNFPVTFAAILLLFYGVFILRNSRGKVPQIIFGILLAWATSKPQFMWLHTVFILIFIFRRQLWTLLTSFIASLVAMLALTLIWLPGWPVYWATQLVTYVDYHSPITEVVTTSLIKAILPPSAASVMTIILFILYAIITLWLFLRWWQGKIAALPVIAWCGFVTFSIDPYGYSYAQITFWIPFILWAITQKKPSLRLQAFWVVNVIISWLLFWVGTFDNLKVAVRDWPLLIYLAWMIWLFLWKSARESYLVEAEPPPAEFAAP